VVDVSSHLWCVEESLKLNSLHVSMSEAIYIYLTQIAFAMKSSNCKYRIFYEVQNHIVTVIVVSIGMKEHNKLYIRGKDVKI
jgi:hypothetical protein